MLPKPRQREFGLMQNWQEIHMLNQKSHHLPRPQSPEKPLLSMAMAFAQEVAAKFKKLETGYRNGLYNFFGEALISYRNACPCNRRAERKIECSRVLHKNMASPRTSNV